MCSSQEAILTTGHETTDWFQIGKGVREGFILSPCLFNVYAECIMRNTGLDEAQAGIKIARGINRWYYSNDRMWRETKEPLDEDKKETEKAGLEFNIQKTKIMASCPIISWQIEGGKSGSSDRFYFSLAPKSVWTVTTGMKLKDACSLEQKLWQT